MRQSRELGMTSLSLQYNRENNQDKKEKLKEKLQQRAIEHYIANNYQYNGVQIPMDQFATYIDMNMVTLIRVMNRNMERTNKLLEGEQGAQFTRGLLLGLFKKSLEISESCKSQSLLLKACQGDSFKPFLTAELNRSLASEINSLNPTIQLLKLVMDKSTINPIIQIVNNLEQNNQYITPLEASKLIETKHLGSVLTDQLLLAETVAEEGLDDLPEVGAKHQDLTKIGIRYKPSGPTKDAEIIS